MTYRKAENWSPSDEDLAALRDLPSPEPMDAETVEKGGYTYPHCNTWATGRQCVEDLDVGVIYETRCIQEDGSVTREYECRIGG